MSVLGIFSLIFLCLIGLFFTGLSIYLKIKNMISKKEMICLLIFALISILLGVAFVGHKDFKQFSFLQIMLIFFCISLAFPLNVFIKKLSSKKYLSYIFSLLFLTFFITKFFFEIPFYEKLPLNICNIVCVLIIIRPFFKTSFFDSYILTFGFIGAISNAILGDWFSNKDQFIGSLNAYINTNQLDFFNIRCFESNMVHNFYLTYCIYMLLSKSFFPNVKKALLNFYWIVPFYFILVFLNQIFKFNFFFTSEYRNPLLFIYEALFNIFGFKIGMFKINLVYDILLIGGAILIILLFNYLLSLKFKPKEIILGDTLTNDLN
ncbi:MAG: YwaF family protein [Acholeplasmatales bacterium]|jgi:hypothetical protein|nr:YwaF family protein [Acholeplasmatales bacterium]